MAGSLPDRQGFSRPVQRNFENFQRRLTDIETAVAAIGPVSGVGLVYAETIGDGATTDFLVTHNLSTDDVSVTVYRTGDGVEVLTEVDRSSVDALHVRFALPPTSASRRVVVRK